MSEEVENYRVMIKGLQQQVVDAYTHIDTLMANVNALAEELKKSLAVAETLHQERLRFQRDDADKRIVLDGVYEVLLNALRDFRPDDPGAAARSLEHAANLIMAYNGHSLKKNLEKELERFGIKFDLEGE